MDDTNTEYIISIFPMILTTLIFAPYEVVKIQRKSERLPEAYYYQNDLVAESI